MNETKVRKFFIRTIWLRVWCIIYMYVYLTGCATWSNCDLTTGKCVFSIISYVIELLPNVCSCCKRQRENLSARALHYENFSLFLLQFFFACIALHMERSCCQHWNINGKCFESLTVTFYINTSYSYVIPAVISGYTRVRILSLFCWGFI